MDDRFPIVTFPPKFPLIIKVGDLRITIDKIELEDEPFLSPEMQADFDRIVNMYNEQMKRLAAENQGESNRGPINTCMDEDCVLCPKPVKGGEDDER